MSAEPASTEHASTCRLRVLFFSILREKVGREACRVTLPAPATGEDLLDHLAERHGEIGAYRPVIRLAVNEAYVPTSAPLADGDEVALITPVSGG